VRVRAPVLVLGAAAAVLAGIVGFELVPDQAAAPVVADARPAKPAAPAAAAKAAAPDHDDMVETLLARPLFSPSRRPDRAAAPAEAGKHDADAPRLAGILIDGPGKRAIFALPSGDSQVFVEEGGEVEGWSVDEITPASVTLTGPEGSRKLEPSFDPNAKPAEPAMPPKVNAVPANAPTPAAAAARNGPLPAGLPADPRHPMPAAAPGAQPNRAPLFPRPPAAVRHPNAPSGE
jgi:hypothetical protein